MASTTAAKKELVDFLWEWAETHGDWAKILVQHIVNNECAPSAPELDEIFDYFLESIKLKSALPKRAHTKPVYVAATKTIRLQKLENVRGVNKLAPGQVLSFSPNITVVYGENGSGKTGYARILKSLGFSYSPASGVLGNVYGKQEPQAGDITFESGGITKSFHWNGKDKDSELSAISVFTNNCVHLSLGDARTLIVTPSGFHLFNIITASLAALEEKLNRLIASYQVTLPWIDALHPDTPQHQFITGLSAKSSLTKLAEMASFTPAHEKQLQALQKSQQDLNPKLISAEIKDATLKSSELTALVTKIKSISRLFSSATLQSLDNSKQEIIRLKQKTQSGLTDIVKGKGIEMAESAQFHAFLTAAENYIKTIEQPAYPTDGDPCIYCRQPLGEDANALLTSYRQLLNDTTKEDLAKAENERSLLLKELDGVDVSMTVHQPTFGTTESGGPLQPTLLTNLQKALSEFKENVGKHMELEKVELNMDFVAALTFLEEKLKNLRELGEKKKTDLDTLTIQEKKYKTQIEELLDRQYLSGKLAEIKTVIANNQTVGTLRTAANKFNSRQISSKTTEARDALVNQNFHKIFENELKAFRKEHIKVNMDFGTAKGNSQVKQKIQSCALTDILSEGEQKAIALAEFLTELQLDKSTAPVVFDDPVNSLDHNIIDDVSKRFIRLSRDRQVIVFTHSILLFNSLIQKSELQSFKDLTYKYYETHTDLNATGYLHVTVDGKKETFKSYEGQINAILSLPKEQRSKNENDLAVDGYEKLRSAIEVFVEDDMLKNMVRRYRKNVAMTALEKVNGQLIDECKEEINDVFERCCGYIEGHSNPDGLQAKPSLLELKNDLARIKAIQLKFK